MIKRLRGASVLRRYMISYLGIALLSCLLIGMVLLYTYLVDFTERQETLFREKAQLVATDMSQQVSLLRTASHKLSIDTLYRPGYLHAGKYSEIRMLEDFKRYAAYSLITQDAFLLYRGEDAVYMTSGLKADAALHLAALGAEDTGAWLTRLNAVDQMEMATEADMEHILLLLPIGSPIAREATLAFAIDKRALLARMETVSGGLDGQYLLSFGGEAIVSTMDDTAARMTRLTATSPDGDWTVHIAYDGSVRLPTRARVFVLAAIVAAIAAVIGISIWTAYRHYKPIKRLTLQHAAHGPDAMQQDEFQRIEAYMDSLAETSLRARERLETNASLMRQQLMHLLVNGIYTPKVDEYLDRLHMRLNGPWFFVMVASCEKEDGLPGREHAAETAALVDDLSDDESSLYATYDEQLRKLIILASVQDQAQWQEMDGLVQDVLSAAGFAGTLGKGGVYESLSRMSASYLEAVLAASNALPPQEAGGAPHFDRGLLAATTMAIRAHNPQQAQDRFHQLMERLDTPQISVLLLRYAFAEIMVELIEAARAVQVAVPEHMIYAMVTATTHRDFLAAAGDLLGMLAEGREMREGIPDDIARDVLTYVMENIESYSLSIESVAKALDMSVSRISGVVKACTGMYYKDYVISLRIEKAKAYLAVGGMTVAETCEKVGYGNISHFIKTFKSIVGVTPGVYQRQQHPE